MLYLFMNGVTKKNVNSIFCSSLCYENMIDRKGDRNVYKNALSYISVVLLLSVLLLGGAHANSSPYEPLEPARQIDNQNVPTLSVRLPVSIYHREACDGCLSFNLSRALQQATTAGEGNFNLLVNDQALEVKNLGQYLSKSTIQAAYLFIETQQTILQGNPERRVLTEHKNQMDRATKVDRKLIAKVFEGKQARKKIVVSRINQKSGYQHQIVNLTESIKTWFDNKGAFLVLDMPNDVNISRGELSQSLNQHTAYLELYLYTKKGNEHSQAYPLSAYHSSDLGADRGLGREYRPPRDINTSLQTSSPESDDEKISKPAVGAWVAVSALAANQRRVGKIRSERAAVAAVPEALIANNASKEKEALVTEATHAIAPIAPIATLGEKIERTQERSVLKGVLGLLSFKALFRKSKNENFSKKLKNKNCQEGEVLTGFNKKSQPVCESISRLLQESQQADLKAQRKLSESTLTAIAHTIQRKLSGHVQFNRASKDLGFGEGALVLGGIQLAPPEVHIMGQTWIDDKEYQLTVGLPQMGVLGVDLLSDVSPMQKVKNSHHRKRIDTVARSSAWDVELDIHLYFEDNKLSEFKLSNIAFRQGLFQNFNLSGMPIGPVESQSLWLAIKHKLADFLHAEYEI